MINPDVVYYPKEAVLNAIEHFDCPFFLYEEAKIRKNARHFRDTFRKYFPDFKPLYAVKANCNPHLLKLVIDEGFEMDASSESEVWISKKLGVGGTYTAGYTLDWELKFAKDNGFVLNLDDIKMIPFLEKIGVPEALSFRINPGVGKGTMDHSQGEMDNNVLAGPDAKFGIPHEKAVDCYKQAKELGVKSFGIHMMTGSNVHEEAYFTNVFAKLLDVIANVQKEAGIEIGYLNIGGGFGVPYRPEEKSLDLEFIAKNAREVMDKKCKEHGIKEPRLIAEPGRYIMCDAGWLVAKVHLIKESYKKFVGICASSNDMPRPAIYNAYHHVSIINDADETEQVSVVGKICENSDQWARDRVLPKCKAGDVVVIHNCGAHAFSMGHNYNGKVKHAEYLFKEDGSFKMIRRKETFEDLYRTTEV